MFTDINVSEDFNDKFNVHCREESKELGVDFSILILQAGAWPISQTNLPTFSLPQELEKSVRIVRKFYFPLISNRPLDFCVKKSLRPFTIRVTVEES